MKIGLVGYQGAGKSTLFQWLTGEPADPAQSHLSQSAMAAVPDQRVPRLCDIYSPKKITLASLEITDTPGLSRDHQGSAGKLAAIREAGCLVIVASAFGGGDALADINNFEDDLLIADLDIVEKRIERLKEAVKKPRPDQAQNLKELEFLGPFKADLESGKPLTELELSPDQRKQTRSFQLFAEKPRLVIVNTTDDEPAPEKYTAAKSRGAEVLAIPLGLQLDLANMGSDEEREEFCREMQVRAYDRDELLRKIMLASGQMLFFTAGEKEVRTWMIPQGATAVEAAGSIHTDLARGFIRAETMNCDDLIRLGSEREIKAQNLLRREHKDYVIQDGDILMIQHN